MSNLEWFSTKRNSDGSFSILVPKDWPESIKHKALDAIELGIQAGAEKEQERIIKLLEEPYFLEPLVKALNTLSDLEFKLPDGNDVVEMNFARQELHEYTQNLIALIKGEK